MNRRTVHGIAARLHTPMQGRPIQFGAPGPSPYPEGAPIDYQGARVGQVLAVWVEEDRVHWIGLLDPPPPLKWVEDPEPSIAVPVPEPTVPDMIDGAWLVGVPALTQARTERGEGGVTVLAGWTVACMQLLRPADAPWPGLTLNLR